MNNLSINELEKVTESEEIDNATKDVIHVFLDAINDWPVGVDSIELYEYEVKNFINQTTTEVNIKDFLKHINVIKNSWESESLTQLLEVFEFYDDGVSIKDIIDNLKSKIYPHLPQV
ncbi:MAG: hypothetical protein RLO12_09670 [Fulvivirga sp.]|uniref:hypothetical protein n=1 Tax=Fulvivirga sp. TaxID=1931237 RepID=UPI003304255E